jgi:hypothetical protein
MMHHYKVVGVQSGEGAHCKKCMKEMIVKRETKRKAKTYNSGYSLVVTYLTTNPPVRCLNRAERTGSLVVSCSIVTYTLEYTVFGFLSSVNGSLAHCGHC